MQDSNNKPEVTVLMPVYNGENYLREAIDSILNQTYSNFEFLIIDDGSTDDSSNIINSYTDTRINFVRNLKNMGIVNTLNLGLDIAKGEFIARMDCDDISLPDRLKKQITYMQAHSKVGVCGSWVKVFSADSEKILMNPEFNDSIKSQMIFGPSIAHPSAMLRANMIHENNLRYSDKYLHAEDYDFWLRCSEKTKLANIPAVLLLYRTHQNSVGTKHETHQEKSSEQIRSILLNKLNITPTHSEHSLHNAISLFRFNISKTFLLEAKHWLELLKDSNERTHTFNKASFSKLLGVRWLALCNHNTSFGLWTWNTFNSSTLSGLPKTSGYRKLKFLLKCCLKHERN